jgi:hypothetical protein
MTRAQARAVDPYDARRLTLIQAIQGKTGCKGRSIRMDKLDGLVLEQMAAHLFTRDRLMVLLQEYLDRSEEAQAGRKEKLRQLKIEVTEVDGRLRKLLAMVESGVMQPDDPILAERVAQIRLHRQETLERVEMLERELRLPGNQVSVEKIATCGSCFASNCRMAIPLFVRRISICRSTGSKSTMWKCAFEAQSRPSPQRRRANSPSLRMECPVLYENGVPGVTRTRDPRFRKPMLYPTELRGRKPGAGSCAGCS